MRSVITAALRARYAEHALGMTAFYPRAGVRANQPDSARCNRYVMLSAELRCIVERTGSVPRKTAALLVLLLTAATVRPLACAWWCTPGEAVDASCHEQASTDRAQLATGSGCDLDVADATATITKTTSLERIAFVAVSDGHRLARFSGDASRMSSSSPPGRSRLSVTSRSTVLRI